MASFVSILSVVTLVFCLDISTREGEAANGIQAIEPNAAELLFPRSNRDKRGIIKSGFIKRSPKHSDPTRPSRPGHSDPTRPSRLGHGDPTRPSRPGHGDPTRPHSRAQGRNFGTTAHPLGLFIPPAVPPVEDYHKPRPGGPGHGKPHHKPSRPRPPGSGQTKPHHKPSRPNGPPGSGHDNPYHKPARPRPPGHGSRPIGGPPGVGQDNLHPNPASPTAPAGPEMRSKSSKAQQEGRGFRSGGGYRRRG